MVGQRTTVQSEDHQGDETKQAGETDVSGASRNDVDLRGHGDDVELCADDGDDVGRPETAKVHVPQRGDIRKERAHGHGGPLIEWSCLGM